MLYAAVFWYTVFLELVFGHHLKPSHGGRCKSKCIPFGKFVSLEKNFISEVFEDYFIYFLQKVCAKKEKKNRKTYMGSFFFCFFLFLFGTKTCLVAALLVYIFLRVCSVNVGSLRKGLQKKKLTHAPREWNIKTVLEEMSHQKM